MDGLIDQAKSQLWNVVNELARARRSGKAPSLEVALYEYGNDRLPESQGYIRKVSEPDDGPRQDFRGAVQTEHRRRQRVLRDGYRPGGAKALMEQPADVLKVIYIAGNEEFTQGPDPYAAACGRAIRKGIIVNTIFCGGFQEGVEGKWKNGAEVADGRYMSIDQDHVVEAIATPFDKDIVRLGNELNATYVGYGSEGEARKERQAEQDSNAAAMGAEATVQRSMAKAGAPTRTRAGTSWTPCRASRWTSER